MRISSRAWLAILVLALVLLALWRTRVGGALRGEGTAVPESPVGPTAKNGELERAPLPAESERSPAVPSAPAQTLLVPAPEGGSVIGRILAPDGNARSWVDLHLLGKTPLRGSHEFHYEPDGHFRFGNLDAGLYRLELSLFGGLPGTHTIHAIAVREGETVTLEPIDLESVWHVVRLDVRDESGAPVPGLNVWLPAQGVEGWVIVATPVGDEGERLLRSFEATPRLRLTAPGFLQTELVDPLPRERVVLARGPSVHLRLHAELPALPESWSLQVHLVQDERWEPDRPVAFDPEGEAVLTPARTGEFYVGLVLQLEGGAGYRGLDGLGWWIEVAASAGEQVFTSPPFTAEFLDNIARLTDADR